MAAPLGRGPKVDINQAAGVLKTTPDNVKIQKGSFGGRKVVVDVNGQKYKFNLEKFEEAVRHNHKTESEELLNTLNDPMNTLPSRLERAKGKPRLERAKGKLAPTQNKIEKMVIQARMLRHTTGPDIKKLMTKTGELIREAGARVNEKMNEQLGPQTRLARLNEMKNNLTEKLASANGSEKRAIEEQLASTEIKISKLTLNQEDISTVFIQTHIMNSIRKSRILQKPVDIIVNQYSLAKNLLKFTLIIKLNQFVSCRQTLKSSLETLQNVHSTPQQIKEATLAAEKALKKLNKIAESLIKKFPETSNYLDNEDNWDLEKDFSFGQFKPTNTDD